MGGNGGPGVSAKWICAALAAGLPAPAVAAAVTETRGFLRPLGPIAELQRTELIWATVLILAAILPVLFGVPWILWRYRRANTAAKYRPQWHFNTKLEILMWAGPALIVAALSLWLAQAVFRIDPYRAISPEMAEGMDFAIDGDTVPVDVIGLDWKWVFVYPEHGVASVGEMVVPVGRPVSLRLTTDTVMQSFMAPGLSGQIYAMAGMVTRQNLIATETGSTLGTNTQYNGPGFARQRAPVRAVTPETFEDWIAAARSGGTPLDEGAYARLARSGDLAQARADLDLAGEGPILFTLAAPDLFDRVVARYMSGQEIAREAQPGSPSYRPEALDLPDAPATMMEHAQ